MLSLAALSNALQNTLSKISFLLVSWYCLSQVLQEEMRSSKVVRMTYNFMVKNSCHAEHHNIFDSLVQCTKEHRLFVMLIKSNWLVLSTVPLLSNMRSNMMKCRTAYHLRYHKVASKRQVSDGLPLDGPRLVRRSNCLLCALQACPALRCAFLPRAVRAKGLAEPAPTSGSSKVFLQQQAPTTLP